MSGDTKMKIAKVGSWIAAGASLLSLVGAVHADSAMGSMDMSRYGGPVYTGAPALAVTASLVKAGGGADNFSIATALTSMVGPKLVTAEVNKLTTQYGSDKVTQWITTFNFAVGDALKIATADGVTLPNATLSGKPLAVTLVKAGLDKHGIFYTEYLLDKAVTHNIHNQVMNDIDAKYGGDVDTDYHAISNQAMVDLAHALGYPNVQVASLH
jgi:hypothetical protein